jgi:hypothetical protein
LIFSNSVQFIKQQHSSLLSVFVLQQLLLHLFQVPAAGYFFQQLISAGNSNWSTTADRQLTKSTFTFRLGAAYFPI